MQIIKSNDQVLIGLTSEQRDLIKETLTYDNPAYKSAKRYSRSKYISIPPYLTYYSEESVSNGDGTRSKVMHVPIGVDVDSILDTHSEILDKRSKDFMPTFYPPFKLELRKDQFRAKEAYLKSANSQHSKNIVQLPTGKGKSILALSIASELQERTLILVHKDDLVVGWQKDIKLCFGDDIEIGLIKAKKREVGEQITIATVQTLSRMSKEELSNYTNQFGLVVQDECLVGNTLVVQEDGSVKSIKNVHNNNTVLGGKVSSKFSRQSNIWELESSHSILKGSPTHPTWCVKKSHNGHTIYTESDFEVRPIKDLNSDYMIPIRVSIPHTPLIDLSEDLARFIAMIQCDGHLDSNSKRVKVNVQKDRKYYYDVMSKGCEDFGAELKFSNDNRENITYWTTDPNVRSFLNQIIPSGKKSNIIEVPMYMYSAPLNSIKAYIETCFNCEGDLSVGKSSRINFNTCSEYFAQGLSMLLKKFGILSNIQHIRRRKNRHNDIYRLSICGVFFNKFMDEFSLIDRKMTPNRNKADKNKNRFVGDYYLSDVKCSSPCGYSDIVYDFTVEDTHSFVANGVYTHNCHHVGLNIFNVINSFNSKYKLGLSATPKRADGLNFVFDLYFGGLCYKYVYDPNDTDITQVKVNIRKSPFKYRPFLYKGQIFNYYDFPTKDLPDTLDFLDQIEYGKRPILPFLTIDNEIVKSMKHKVMVCKDILFEYNQGHSCIALFTQKEHINLYYTYLCRYIPKDKIMLYYGDNKEDSETLMQKADSKEVLVTLATYAKATEGTNVKSWEVEFLVSSVNNEKNVEQATGRIRRSKKGKLNPVIVYDYECPDVYSVASHINTRIKVYKRLKYIINDPTRDSNNRGLFSRGYKR